MWWISFRQLHFYPRPPRGGRHDASPTWEDITQFLSTPSARRATSWAKPDYIPTQISIHALREEGDTSSTPKLRPRADFYPRPPRGGRPCLPGKNTFTSRFLSTPSARRATSS